MSFMKIHSTNPNLSFILSKNPNTIRESGRAFMRKIRKGKAYGWFNEKDSEFKLWFKDSMIESSFAPERDENFEYLDKTRYGSPYIPIQFIQECLSSASKDQHEQDVEGEGLVTTITYPSLISSRRWVNQIGHQFSSQGCTVSMTDIGKSHALIQVTAPTVFKALNIVQIISILQSLGDKDTYVPTNKESLAKYLKVLNRAQAPYYPRYLVQMKIVQNRDLFNAVKEELQGPGMTMFYGDTARQRLDVIRQVLQRAGKADSLVEVGCGDMFQTLRLVDAYHSIVAIDADPELTENNLGKVKGRSIDNVTPLCIEASYAYFEGNDEWSMFSDCDVLMSEVLEHMEKDEAQALLNGVLTRAEPNKVVVTCPNKDFNKHYGLTDDEARHWDHKWEPTRNEFIIAMNDVLPSNLWKVEVSSLGDVVDSDSVSLIAVFTKKREV